MKKNIIYILIILTFGCANKNLNTGRIYIQNNNLFGELINGIPENDTLIEIRNEKGKITGIGKMAIEKDEISELRFGEWKEYNHDGVISAEGSYKIGSYIDCCMGGACRVFYYYRQGKWNYYKKDGELDFSLNFIPKEHTIETRCEGGDNLIFGLVEKIPPKFRDSVKLDKIYELQKITFSDSYFTTTLIPLNGKVHIEIESEL